MGEGREPVIGPWAVRLPAAQRPQLAALRLVPGIDVNDGAELWLRGERADAALWQQLAALPDAERFERHADGRCHAPGGRLPLAQAPLEGWRSLRDWMPLTLPVPCLPAIASEPPEITILPGGDVAEPNLLLTTVAALCTFADTAAAVRLSPLRFCADADGRALVHGRPLPPLPGPVWIEQCGIAVAAGHRLMPELPPSLLQERLQLATGDLVRCDADGRCERIAASAFVQLTRSAVRLTAVELARG